MHDENFVWLFLEPFVHLSTKNGHHLFYNAITKKILEFHSDQAVDKICHHLSLPVNGYVIPLCENDFQLPSVTKLIRQLKRQYMVDILRPEWSSGKPVNILPLPVVKKTNPETPAVLSDHLKELLIHVNSDASAYLELYDKALYQFPFPSFQPEKSREMQYPLLQSVLQQLKELSNITINIIGSDIFQYSWFDEMVSLLNNSAFNKRYYLPIDQFNPEKIQQIKKNSTLSFLVTFPMHLSSFEKIGREISSHQNKYLPVEFIFIVQNPEEVKQSQEVIQLFSLNKVYFKPYYNGKNLRFFEEQVFMTKEDIFASKPDQKQIFSRMTFNENDLGKITILPDGKTFANINDKVLGNLTRESLHHIILRECDSGRSWKRTRAKVNPCKDCVYHFLCPPISNYELFLKRFNFCHIIP